VEAYPNDLGLPAAAATSNEDEETKGELSRQRVLFPYLISLPVSLPVNLGHVALSALFQEWKKASTASTTEPEESDSSSDEKEKPAPQNSSPKTASPSPSKIDGGGDPSSGNKTKEDSSLVGKILGLGQKGASKGDVPAVPPKDSTPVSPNKFSLARSDFLNFLFVYFFRNLSPYLICPGTPL